MLKRRIIAIPDGMKWEDFREQFRKFFPISDESKREIKLREEYKRLTNGKITPVEFEPGDADTGRSFSQDNGTRKSSRKRGNKSEHGSTLAGDGLGGGQPTELQRDIGEGIREAEGGDTVI